MTTHQHSEHSNLLSALAEKYSKTSKVQFALRLVGEEDSHIVEGREASDLIVFYDPTNKSADDLSLIADGYVAHNEEELEAIMKVVSENPDIYAGKEGLSDEFAEYDEDNWQY